MIVESENNIVRKLSREEILTIYREFDNNLCGQFVPEKGNNA